MQHDIGQHNDGYGACGCYGPFSKKPITKDGLCVAYACKLATVAVFCGHGSDAHITGGI